MDAMVHGVAKSWTHLSNFHFTLKWNQGASQVALVVRNLPANTGDIRDRFDPWVGKIPWRRA